ncbi:MAG: integrase arm-type DNA-binding domain-containing protein [Deltaproteobacteria bacterium]|nr:integrase arm-type DNA-binding domain-containing protein [Deltaproteobacteria bacterium]
MGVYPEVSLKDARQRLEEERRILRGGEDPSRKRQEAKTAGVDKSKNTFEVVTLEWLAKFSGNWVPNHQTRVLGLFKNHVFPEIGAMPIADVTEKDLLDVLAKLQVVTEDRDKPAIDTAHRVRAYFGRIYRYALPSRRIKSDPTPALRDCLPPCQRGTSPP